MNSIVLATSPVKFRSRALIFTGMAIVFHLCLWHLLSDSLVTEKPAATPNNSIEVQFKEAPAAIAHAVEPARNVIPKPPARSAKAAKPVTTAAKPAQALENTPPVMTPGDTESAPTAVTEPAPTQEPASPAQEIPAAEPAPVIAASTASASADNEANQVTELAGLKITAPPSGKMHMKVVRISPNMNPVYGLGEISWQAQDGQYQMQVQASLDLLFTSLNLYKLQSEGSLSANGIQPKRMSETRRGRSETATHFDYDANQLSFSSSNKNTELSKGAQDRATIFMQLAGLGIASPEQFQPGRQISVQVAEDRDANQFIFVVIGQEEIETALGKIMTWHVKRPPRTGLYNSTLELWFAPAYQWYPVQIRNTETNGAVTTQTVSKIQLQSTSGK
ncbi:DUF3108 domain-containing protein [Undibacterium sp. FT147W]|uniref:DUF3108 domain-containing protein n=1 Tax=Undibacterium rivi TaxID=2828729 RepID=A0ABS5H5M4_9BURK|nr:DUF3108 domain-containing protein [Undibacterium rivi]MBR7794133.1 DUF3108 domain-containing protein [Undibacterium rivi]